MKYKKLVILIAVFCMVLAGCAKTKPAEQSAQSTDGVQQPETNMQAAESAVQTLAPSSNKEVVTEKTAPKIFWAMDIAYHLENCQAISGVDAKEIPWSMVQEIGLRQCPECNPPRYEDYVE